MPFNTTALNISTSVTAVITTGTTHANLRGGSLYDLVPVALFNDGAIRVWLGGSSALTSADGFPLLSSAYHSAQLMPSDPLFAVTTNSTSTLHVMVGRQ